MQRTITVKGTGKLSVSPDLIMLHMPLETTDIDYETASKKAACRLEYLNKSLESIGFEKEAVKTTEFNIRTNYNSIRDSDGNYRCEFVGYVCLHRLKLDFDFDTARLTQALFTISKCLAHPELHIVFTVKDKNAVSEALLKSAAENAKAKAKTLCNASGVKLGQLLNIDYNWSELNIISPTRFAVEEKCLEMTCDSLISPEINPDNISVSDSATFVWEIE